MCKPINFKLQNGLEATWYPPRSAEVEHRLNCCRLREVAPVLNWSLCMIEVALEDEKVLFFYLSHFGTPKKQWSEAIITKLEKEMNDALLANELVIYAGTAYLWHKVTNRAIAEAVARRVKPSLAVLMQP